MPTLKHKSSGRMASKGHPNPIDVHVGAKIRERRHALGISQTTLADQIGLTFQQIQKYERGANRVAASRLVDFAEVLTVPIAFFFDDLPRAVRDASPAKLAGRTPPQVDIDRGDRALLETVKLLKQLSRKHLDTIRKIARELIKDE